MRQLLAPNERTIHFALPSVADAQSYHFQFAPPVAIAVADCALNLIDPYQAQGPQPGRVVGGTGHLHVSGASPGTEGRGEVVISPTYHGPVTAALVSAGINLIVIWVFTIWALVVPRYFGQAPIEAISTWQALFIALPAFAAGFLANQGELGLLSSILGGARLTLLASSATTLLVALAIAIQITGTPLTWTLIGASFVSLICLLRLIHWYVRCRKVVLRS